MSAKMPVATTTEMMTMASAKVGMNIEHCLLLVILFFLQHLMLVGKKEGRKGCWWAGRIVIKGSQCRQVNRRVDFHVRTQLASFLLSSHLSIELTNLKLVDIDLGSGRNELRTGKAKQVLIDVAS
jgi:hypothetical protein